MKPRFRGRPALLLLMLLLVLKLPPAAVAGPAVDDDDLFEFAFDPVAFAPKPFSWGGYLELKGEHLRLNSDGALYLLRHYRQPRSRLNRLTPAMQLQGRYRRGNLVVQGKANAAASWDEATSTDRADLLEGYLSFTPSPRRSLDLGKKTYNWGTGYAFNPVGFIQRPKDPDNPEESREGYVTGGLELTRSTTGALKTATLNLVALPVTGEINRDFGAADHLNLAARLYLLYRNTDLNLLGYTGDSRPDRFGVAAARNLRPNFAIHGELAHIPRQNFQTLQADGSVLRHRAAATSYLLGLRYLTARQLTIITEYYHNGEGYRRRELGRFYDLIHDGHLQYQSNGGTAELNQAAGLAPRYGRPQAGRNYLYTRLSWKEPADIPYFTPALTLIANLDDGSASLSPEALYTGFTNWETRLRLTLLTGGSGREYGERANQYRLELRLRRFF